MAFAAMSSVDALCCSAAAETSSLAEACSEAARATSAVRPASSPTTSRFWPACCDRVVAAVCTSPIAIPMVSRPSTTACATDSIPPTFVVPTCIVSAISRIWPRRNSTVLVTSRAARALESASWRTSSATTANPRPCSPARAASIAALSASRLVWEEICLMRSMKSVMDSDWATSARTCCELVWTTSRMSSRVERAAPTSPR